MYKLSQRELLEEGLWDSFKNSKIGRFTKGAIQLGKEIGKVVAPNTSSKLTNIASGFRSAKQRIKQSYQTLEERILDWMDEQGIVPIPDDKIKIGKNTPKGQHYLVKVAQKGVTPTGESVAGKKFRYPQAIVLFDKDKDIFEWVIKPRTDVFMKIGKQDEYWDDNARPEGEEPLKSTPEDDKNPEEEKINKEIQMLKKQKQLEKLRKWNTKNNPNSPASP